MPSSTIRFTPDFVEACEKLWRDGYNNGVNGEDKLPDFKLFFNNDNIKEEPSFQEMENLPFNPSKCEARVEKHGYAIQCTRSPFSGGCLCKTHQNMFDKLSEGKDIPYGRFNKPRPDVTLDKGNPISWGAKKGRKKNEKNISTQPKLKVGEMRDYLSSRIPVDDFRGLKKKELTEIYLKTKEKENTSSEEEENSPQVNEINNENIDVNPRGKPEEKQPEEQHKEEEQSQEKQHEEKPEAKPKEEEHKAEEQSQEEQSQEGQSQGEKPEEKSEEEQSQEDDAKGVGLHLEPVKPSTLSEFKALFKELSIDTKGLRGVRAYKQAYDDYLREKEEEKTQPMSDEDDDLQEDTNSYEETDFEGVSYLEEEDSGKIYNLKHQHVGKWNQDFDDIIWISEEFKVTHEASRQ
tara:strand:+ start:237 stop:1451 length:1215 start_codon:yes stop_codon:yes gene_type:complete